MERAKEVGVPTLFGERIPTLSDVIDGDLIDVRNSSEARFALSPDKRRWVRKRELVTGYEALVSEALGFLLARELSVPVPQGAITGEGTGRSWLSLFVPGCTHWDASRIHLVSNLHDVGRMFALDAIIFNPDRHSQNILLQVDPHTTDDLRLWCIDVGDSLLGYPHDLFAAGTEPPTPRNIARGLPLAEASSEASAAAEAATLLSKGLVRQMVDEVCRLVGGVKEEALLLEALWRRLQNAPAITHDYLKRLEAFV
ncbi:hypothetical protein LZ198_15635 [Myxococcus sp. K15C18031901]|uniref:hypothetical protein n=1 Tax=Myxococcus dinghuensis TaxID=2906761 RepID=UPI0020A7DEFB|nr:hypothetical protein [Myxococcus dinghuensis]MCP3100302.1 hypothetical protein [Myxococcus dinghuensis]